MDAVLITSTGILAKELGVAPFQDPTPDALARLYAAEGQYPVASMAAFRW
jgi:hypothetical protein